MRQKQEEPGHINSRNLPQREPHLVVSCSIDAVVEASLLEFAIDTAEHGVVVAK